MDIDFEQMAEGLPEALVLETEAHQVLWANDAARRSLGARAGEQSPVPGDATEQVASGRKSLVMQKVSVAGMVCESKSCALGPAEGAEGEGADEPASAGSAPARRSVLSVLTDVSALESMAATWSSVAEASEIRAEALEHANAALALAQRELASRMRIADAFLRLDGDAMFIEVLQTALEALDSGCGVFGSMDAEGALVVPTMTRHVWSQCEVAEKRHVFARETWGDSSWPRAIRQRELLYSNEPSTGTPEGHVQILRHISAPIVHGEVVVGLLQVANKPTDYTAEDLRLAQVMADQIAPILHARIQRDEQDRARREAEDELTHHRDELERLVTERTRELSRANDRYRSLVEASAQIVWTTNAAGEVLADIPTYRDYTGQTYDEVSGWGWTEAVHPEDRDRAAEVWSGCVRDRSLYLCEYRLRRHDGAYRVFEARGVPVVEADGAVREWTGTCTDVTDQREAEVALREANARRDALLAAVPEIVMEVDGDAVYTWANDAGLRFFGPDCIGRRASDYFVGDQDTPGAVRPVLEGSGDTLYAESWQQRADGEARLLAWWCRTLVGADGGRTGALSSARDMTDARRVEAALRESEERFRRSFEDSPIGKALVSPDGGYLYVNRAYCEMLGYGEQELLGLALSEVSSSADANIRRLLAGEQDHCRLGTECAHKDGHRLSTLLSASLVRDGEGRPVHAIVQIQDITELVRHRERLEELVAARTADLERSNASLEHSNAELARSNAELEQFAYVASHDLQEPLRKVKSFTEILAEDYRGRLDDDADRYIGYVVDGASRMQALVQALLTYSRAGRRELARRPTDVAEVLGVVLGNLADLIEEADAVVTHDALPVIVADEVQLTQLLQNLVGNAVKFSRKDGARVHVGAERGPGEWVLSVRDNGIGIDPSQFERVFRVFQRLHPAAEYGGTGIGLSICQRIVERHGGRIWIESEPGQGATFLFTIPAEEADHPWTQSC